LAADVRTGSNSDIKDLDYLERKKLLEALRSSMAEDQDGVPVLLMRSLGAWPLPAGVAGDHLQRGAGAELRGGGWGLAWC
jgi:hypothetical protein